MPDFDFATAFALDEERATTSGIAALTEEGTRSLLLATGYLQTAAA